MSTKQQLTLAQSTSESTERRANSLNQVKGFSICLALGSLVAANGAVKATENYSTFEYSGTTYCIGLETGQYAYSGRNNDVQQPYASSLAAAGNPPTQNYWTLDDAAWGFSTTRAGETNAFAKELSNDVLFQDMFVATGIGAGNQIRGFMSGVFKPNVTHGDPRVVTISALYNVDDSNCVGGDGLINIDDALRELPAGLIARLQSRLAGTTRAQRLAALGRFISAGLLPRNVIAAGGLATQAYVNDLADTVLERLPSRQFQKLQVEEEITEVEIEDTITEPVRGLWKTSGSAEVDIEIASIEMDGDIYVDDPNLTSIYTEPNGTRAWVRGFGGSMSPYDTGGAYGKRGLVFYDDVYNNFYSTHSGLVVGVDTSLSENVQLGIFGNYGNINLTQFAGRDTGGGSWNPNGYGGGVMASYWADNFYVQGAFGATAFSGDNKRQVKIGTIVNETYTATKNTTSYMGTVRVGAPFTWGSAILEPQATAIWNGNEDASYTESGRYRAFALKLNSYSDNFLRTALGAKLAWPIKQGERKLIVPNIKVAWLADWDTNNGAVKFKRAHTRTGRKARTAEIPSNQDTQYGVLLEGGVDYAIAQGPTTAWKLYAKGGAKLWVNKAADWRTSGGITFQF